MASNESESGKLYEQRVGSICYIEREIADDIFSIPCIIVRIDPIITDDLNFSISMTIPDGIQNSEIGFNDDYMKENWSIEDGEIVYSDTLDNHTIETAFAVRGDENLDKMCSRDFNFNFENDSSDLQEEMDDGDEHEILFGDEDEPQSIDDELVSEDSVESGVSQGDIVDAFISDIESENSRILNAFEDATDSSYSTQSKIDHLQTRMSDIEAYSEALEEFIDRNGDAQQILENVHSDIENIEQQIETFNNKIKSIEGDIEDHADDIDTIDSEIESVHDEMETIQSSLKRVEKMRKKLAVVFDE